MHNFSKDAVQAQLERILASPEFVNGLKLGRFLSYVVGQTLSGRSDTIKQYTIAVEGLGYGQRFDPTSSTIIRVLAGRLRRALDRYYRQEGIEDLIRIDIPKGKYIPIFIDNPTASKAPGSSDCPSSVSVHTPFDSSKPAIAVIMFDCLNDKEQFDYIATGLTEEIIISLTRFTDFLVVGPLCRNHEKYLDTRSIGQKYGVRFILDGAIRTNGQKFRLAVKLADAVNGQQLWGKVLDCSLQNGSTMDFENDVVGQVTSTIADNYGFIPRVLTKEAFARHTDNPDVSDAILLYYHHFRVLTEESFTNAVNALEKAVQNEPDHALANAALGDLITASYLFGYDDDDSVLERIEELERKALALDPSCQTACFTMALIHFFKFERTLFLEEVEQAIQINPNNAHYTAAASLHIAMVGGRERANQLMDKAMLLNPHHPGWYHIVRYMNYYYHGEYYLALKEARRFNTPDFFWDPLIRAAVLGQLDRRAEAKKAVDELLALRPDFNQRGPILIRRLAYLDEHVEMLLEGLRKAGLEENRKNKGDCSIIFGYFYAVRAW